MGVLGAVGRYVRLTVADRLKRNGTEYMDYMHYMQVESFREDEGNRRFECSLVRPIIEWKSSHDDDLFKVYW